MTKRQVSYTQAAEYVAKLDLTYLVDTLCSEHYPLPRWSRAEAAQCAELYKKFLLLQKKYWPQPMVPSREIDEFWHNHILSTRNYWQDCLNIFGHYLHHEPLRPETADASLVEQFLTTKQLYLQEYGTKL